MFHRILLVVGLAKGVRHLVTAVDIIAFFILFGLFDSVGTLHLRIGAAVLAARLVSATVNYIANRTVVLRGRITLPSILKYFLLACVRGLLSAAVAILFAGVLNLSIPLMLVIRALFELILFAPSFKVQHNKIFR